MLGRRSLRRTMKHRMVMAGIALRRESSGQKQQQTGNLEGGLGLQHISGNNITLNYFRLVRKKLGATSHPCMQLSRHPLLSSGRLLALAGRKVVFKRRQVSAPSFKPDAFRLQQKPLLEGIFARQ